MGRVSRYQAPSIHHVVASRYLGGRVRLAVSSHKNPRAAFRRAVDSRDQARWLSDHCSQGERVRLYSRPGNDLTRRFPLIVETLARLRSRSCIIDGEAVACDDNGVASFDLVR